MMNDDDPDSRDARQAEHHGKRQTLVDAKKRELTARYVEEKQRILLDLSMILNCFKLFLEKNGEDDAGYKERIDALNALILSVDRLAKDFPVNEQMINEAVTKAEKESLQKPAKDVDHAVEPDPVVLSSAMNGARKIKRGKPAIQKSDDARVLFESLINSADADFSRMWTDAYGNLAPVIQKIEGFMGKIEDKSMSRFSKMAKEIVQEVKGLPSEDQSFCDAFHKFISDNNHSLEIDDVILQANKDNFMMFFEGIAREPEADQITRITQLLRVFQKISAIEKSYKTPSPQRESITTVMDRLGLGSIQHVGLSVFVGQRLPHETPHNPPKPPRRQVHFNNDHNDVD